MRFLSARRSIILLVLALGAVVFFAGGRAGAAGPYQRPRRERGGGRVYKARITPHWFHDNTRFWYRNDLRGGAREFILVDAEAGTRRPAFDHAKLAEALSAAAGTKYRADRLPFETIEFVDGDRAVRFTVGESAWKCALTSYKCTRAGAGVKVPAREKRPAPAKAEGERLGSPWPEGMAPDSERFVFQRRRPPRWQRAARSPDGKWTAFVKDHNLFARSAGGEEVRLSKDGKEGVAYALPSWAPDSKTLVAFRVEPGERKAVYLVESSPRGGGRAKLHARPYALPGDRLDSYELNLFDVASKKQIKPAVDRVDLGVPRVRWKRDGRHFTYRKVDRGRRGWEEG